MKLSDFVMDFLVATGVRHVFLLPGGGAMHLNDSLGRKSGVGSQESGRAELEYVCCLHEQGCAIAADAYGQYSGLGVAMVTTGPGGTNAITGVAGAWLESTPLLMLSGQVKRPDLVGDRGVRQIGFQEIDIVSLVKPLTKYAKVVTEPDSIRAVLEEAMWYATHGRKGPVWVDIPLDVQAAQIEPGQLRGFVVPGNPDGVGASAQSRDGGTQRSSTVEDAAAQTIALLKNAKRPVVLAGNGIRAAGAVEAFLRWAESIGIPILTTWKALDFLGNDHPLYVGRPGAVGQRAANFAQQTADVFISIGARLDFGQTAYNHGNFAPKAKKVIVDIDPKEIEKLQMDIAARVVADAGDFIAALTDVGASLAGARSALPEWSAWRARCADWRKRYPIILPEYRVTNNGVNNYVLVDTIGRLLGDGDLLVPGSSGACSEVTCQALPTPKGLRFINSQGLGAMGFGIPAALGACLASGGKRTVCIDGDGGFVMNAQELAVVSRLKLPIKFFVLNNGGYASIRTTQINYFDRRFVACDEASGLTLPDLKKTADACGIPFAQIGSQDGLTDRLTALLRTAGPLIVDVIMAPDQFTQPKVSSKQQADGKMVTMPMEDLWPFLPREVLAKELA